MDKKTKSPLKDKPLRYVAQSADEELDNLILDKIMLYYLAACGLAVSTMYEWFRFKFPLPNPPVFPSIIFAAGFGFCAYKIYKHIKRIKHLKQGRDGERAVGQYLELFRESGCHIFHDILGKGSNKGIYVVETKTYSKPANGQATITFDGENVFINGRDSKSDIITQTKAASSYIKRLLKESTGKEFETFPVVLFPGWYVEGDGNRKGRIWVLEPKAFRKFLDAQRVKLSPEDVKLASYHLSRIIRAS